MNRRKTLSALVIVLLACSTALFAQAPNQALNDAQAAIQAAEAAGAGTHATALLEEARWRIGAAQEAWNDTRSNRREEAQRRAQEALWAARAAAAKAQWLGTNAAVRDLQADITRLGGTASVSLNDESPALRIERGATSRDRVSTAEAALAQARDAGAAAVVGPELDEARKLIESARKVASANKTSDTADHLAYTGEMMARRAYYLARAQEARTNLQPLQMSRTRLAQAASEREAAAERARREQAQRDAEALQQRLAAEQASRQAAAAELDRLRAQVEENRRLIDQRIEQDRTARIESERRLAELMRQYEGSVATASPSELDALRRQVEDQQLTLRALQQRAQLEEQSMNAEVERLRAELDAARRGGETSQQMIAEREAEIVRRQTLLETMRRERDESVARLTETEQRHQASIAEAQRRRQEAEAAQQQLAQQAQQAQADAERARQDAERARQEADTARQELERTRTEMQQREARRLQLEADLAKLAATRREARGLIVTLPGIFFDTGKSELKAASKKTLDRIADHLKTDAAIQVVVEGHTDSVGSDASNLALSEARAKAVRDYLASRGVADASITSRGLGEGQPVASNKTASGRQQNRRVELVITQ